MSDKSSLIDLIPKGPQNCPKGTYALVHWSKKHHKKAETLNPDCELVFGFNLKSELISVDISFVEKISLYKVFSCPFTKFQGGYNISN